YARMFSTFARVSVAGAVACVLVASPLAQAKRAITEQDLLKFTWIADPQGSPDGKQAVFVRVVVNEKSDDYDTSVWIVPTDGSKAARALTSGTRDTTPRWAPDGQRLAFVRAAGGPPQIFMINLSGGEAQAVTNLPRGAGAPARAAGGTSLAFRSRARAE